ncbi:hypothetical protein F5B20DRAFT_557160 [Whalleya microplaca]|nr:hypothetical protein F5B20DRAFT_557160 [Whalleya microplaca]
MSGHLLEIITLFHFALILHAVFLTTGHKECFPFLTLYTFSLFLSIFTTVLTFPRRNKVPYCH